MEQIQTTLGDLAAAWPVLQVLAELPLGPRARYHVAKLVRLVQPEVAHFYAERDALLRELGQTREGQAGAYELRADSPNWQAFNERLGAVAKIEAPIAWTPLSSTLLDGVQVTAAQLLALGPLCELVEPEEVGKT